MERARLGIYAGFGFSVPFKERLSLIREAGFGATAIWWEEKNPRIRALRHQAPDMIRRTGLFLDNIHVPYFACRDLWSPHADERADAVAMHRLWLDDCARHDIPRMVMHVSLGTSTPEPTSRGLDSFIRLVEHAAHAGISIAIENTREERYIDYLLNGIDCETLTLCFDTSHDRLYAPEQGGLLARWRHRLSALHLSDTDGRRDQHWLPGEGVIDFAALQHHWDDGFDGVYMLECVPRDRNEDPRAFLARAYTSLAAAVPDADRLPKKPVDPLVR